MKFYTGMMSLAAAVFVLGGTMTPVASQAQDAGPGYGVPPYTRWQPDWDQRRFDRHHVMLGTVASFAPYRLTVMRNNGNVQTVDLKHGTIIYPTGATPSSGERVALVGYYSNGTFIVNRVILHP